MLESGIAAFLALFIFIGYVISGIVLGVLVYIRKIPAKKGINIIFITGLVMIVIFTVFLFRLKIWLSAIFIGVYMLAMYYRVYPIVEHYQEKDIEKK